ncbi:MAG: hypothetical protein ABIO71_11595 [Caldimonas sp.]
MQVTKGHLIEAELSRLIAEFFRAVSFETGARPSYEDILELFIERGLLIKNVGPVPEISSLREFIESRTALVDAGTLTRFHEAEISESSVTFGNVGHRFSVYTKSGISGGVPFDAKGMVTTQFVNTQSGWRISSMAWDDERPGLSITEPPSQ